MCIGIKEPDKVDKVTKVELQDCFGAWVEIGDEMDVLDDEELKQCFERHKLTARKTESNITT